MRAATADCSHFDTAFDPEGLAIDRRGFYYVSDEYGANVYVVEQRTGLVVSTIAPPAAVIPLIGGKANFTSETVPDTGRAPNQGLEGLTLDQSQGGLLWGLMQSALVQDSTKASKETNRYARLFGWDVSNPLRARLVHEYVVPLPQSKKLRTRASSEVHVVDANTFLVLARDGNGFGDSSSDSSYKQADLISTVGATDIAGSKFDQPQNPVAPGGVLDASVTPTAYQSFVDLVNKKELVRAAPLSPLAQRSHLFFLRPSSACRPAAPLTARSSPRSSSRSRWPSCPTRTTRCSLSSPTRTSCELPRASLALSVPP